MEGDALLGEFHDAGIYLAHEETTAEVLPPGFYIATETVKVVCEGSGLSGFTRRGLIAGEYEVEYEPGLVKILGTDTDAA